MRKEQSFRFKSVRTRSSDFSDWFGLVQNEVRVFMPWWREENISLWLWILWCVHRRWGIAAAILTWWKAVKDKPIHRARLSQVNWQEIQLHFKSNHDWSPLSTTALIVVSWEIWVSYFCLVLFWFNLNKVHFATYFGIFI